MIRVVKRSKKKQPDYQIIPFLPKKLWPCSENFYFVVFSSFRKFYLFGCEISAQNYTIQLIYDSCELGTKCFGFQKLSSDSAKSIERSSVIWSFSRFHVCADERRKNLIENTFFICEARKSRRKFLMPSIDYECFFRRKDICQEKKPKKNFYRALFERFIRGMHSKQLHIKRD